MQISNLAFDQIIESTEASDVRHIEVIQSLWSDYGVLARVFLKGGKFDSVIVKDIDLSEKSSHPRNWNTNASHLRKLRSYEVESNFYKNYNYLRIDNSYFPELISNSFQKDKIILILEDLSTKGFSLNYNSQTHGNGNKIKLRLAWLAAFHAKGLNKAHDGLWDIGTYWHLDTREDEWKKMEEGPLKQNARLIHDKLNSAKYKAIVHGDAKAANFLFDKDLTSVAAVDFQYVGKGCGIKDIVYFLGSVLFDDELEVKTEYYLKYYFEKLKEELDISLADDLIAEWKYLYDYAVADFERFLLGWMPTHHKLNDYTRKVTENLIK